VAWLEAIPQHERTANSLQLYLERGIAALVVTLDHRYFDRQQPSLTGFAVKETHDRNDEWKTMSDESRQKWET
jgi:hypothetical protein